MVETKEENIGILRSHWVYMLPVLVVQSLALVIIAIVFFSRNLITENSILTNENIGVVLLFFWVVSMAFTSRGILQWIYTVYQITNRRVVVVRLGSGLSLKSQVKEALFELIKSVEHVKPGLLANIFNYGHIRLSTDDIASSSVFTLKYVKNSEDVLKVLEKLIMKRSE